VEKSARKDEDIMCESSISLDNNRRDVKCDCIKCLTMTCYYITKKNKNKILNDIEDNECDLNCIESSVHCK
jgi:hypothetical protein